MRRHWCRAVAVAVGGLLVCLPATPVRAQVGATSLLDRILDVYVRDGNVYYNALRIERANLDRYVASLDVPAASVERLSDPDQRAFWLNAYNALVLRTVINAYPIRGTGDGFPASSVAQIPGGFNRIRHRVAGQVLTLDEIERLMLDRFGDGRMVFALGRGTKGSGRLRSEVYRGEKLETQLNEAVDEFVTRTDNIKIDEATTTVTVTPLYSWREADVVKTFAGSGDPSNVWANRSPLERAVVLMAAPHLFPSERRFLELNTFRMVFGEYDWRLNDLAEGLPDAVH